MTTLPDQFEKCHKCGEGTFGIVLIAREKNTGRRVAVKSFKESDCNSDIASDILREICTLKILRHEKIVSLLDCIMSSESIYAILEEMTDNLKTYSKKFPSGKIPTQTCWTITDQILSAMKYCKQLFVMHRDLKPQNILINSSMLVKVADWGLAVRYQKGRRNTISVQTLWYRAPEVLLENPFYDFSIDIWSIGLIHYEMLTGNPLFTEQSETDMICAIFQMFGEPTNRRHRSLTELFTKFCVRENCTINVQTSDTKSIFTSLSEKDESFVRECLRCNPEDRYAIKDVTKRKRQENEANNKLDIKLGFMKWQPDLNTKMRKILVSWMLEVKVSHRLLSTTLDLAVSILDRMLSFSELKRTHLQLLGITCILISSKLCEVNAIGMNDCIYLCGEEYSRGDIIQMERKVLKALNYDIIRETPLGNVRSMGNSTLNYLADITLISSNYMKYDYGDIIKECRRIVTEQKVDQQNNIQRWLYDLHVQVRCDDELKSIFAQHVVSLDTICNL